MAQSDLLRAKRFAPLFATQFLGAFNDNFFKNALILLITYQSVTIIGIPPGEMVVVAGGIFILPFFLFSATSGQLADKFEKSQIIRLVKIAEIIMMAIAGVGLLTKHMVRCRALLNRDLR
mgnify:CR=1 FL=1